MSASLEQSRIDVLKAAAAAVAPPPRRGRGRSGGNGPGDMEEFLRAYYRLVATEDLLARPARELATIATRASCLRPAPSGRHVQRAGLQPDAEDEGWSTSHSVVQIVVDDMPFLVDSVVAALGGFDRGRAPHRPPADDGGARPSPARCGRSSPTGPRTSPVELRRPRPRVVDAPRDRPAAGRRAARRRGRAAPRARERPRLRRGLAQDARARLHASRASCVRDPARHRPATRSRRPSRFLEWLAHNNFTFLGYREYSLTNEDGHDVSRAGPRHGPRPVALRPPFRWKGTRAHPGRQPGRARLEHPHHHQGQLARHRPPATSTSTTSRSSASTRAASASASSASSASTRPRPTTTRSTTSRCSTCGAQEVLRLTGLSADSHSGKDILQILETYPRDELFQTRPGAARRDRDERAAPAGAAQDQALPATRRVRPFRLVPRLPPA